MKTRIAVLALLAGCFHVEEVPVCILDPEPVDDTFEVGGVDGGDLAVLVLGEGSAAGTYADGTLAEVAWEVIRTGSAEHVVATLGTEEVRSFGTGTTRVDLDPICSSYLRIPVALQVTTLDGAVDAGADTWAALPMTEPGADAAGVVVEATAALDDVTLPIPGPEQPSDFDEAWASFGLTFPTDGALQTGAVSWVGRSTLAEDRELIRAFEVVGW